MKTRLLLSFCFFMLFLFQGSGQDVYEKNVNMSMGINNALYVEIEGADRKVAENVWKNFIKDYGKTKKNKKANEWYAQQVIVPAIYGSTPIDIFIKMEEMRDMTRTYLWVYNGDEFLSSESYGEEADGAEHFLTSFYKEVRKEVVKKEIELEEKTIKNLEKEMKKLEDKNENLHKQIEDLKEKIRKTEMEIEKNMEQQVSKREELKNQRMELEKVISKLNAIGRP